MGPGSTGTKRWLSYLVELFVGFLEAKIFTQHEPRMSTLESRKAGSPTSELTSRKPKTNIKKSLSYYI